MLVILKIFSKLVYIYLCEQVHSQLMGPSALSLLVDDNKYGMLECESNEESMDVILVDMV